MIVIGGGIIGLGTAWRLAEAGMAVELVERGRAGDGASTAGAGMLAWRAEFQEANAAFRLARRSATLWGAWVEALGGPEAVDLVDRGSLVVVPEPEAEALENELAWQREAGLNFDVLDARGLGAKLPGAAPAVAFHFPDEQAIDPRRVMGRLREVATAAGVRLREGVTVERLVTEGERVAGVETTDGRLEAPRVVAAAGAWSTKVGGASALAPVRPVRGQILVLEAPAMPRYVVRAPRRCYMVPRTDGRLLVGSTMEEVGFDVGTTDAALDRLRTAAGSVVPALATAPRADAWAGLRPMTSDGEPLVGPSQVAAGLWYATGHGRNGLLLGPVTADLLAGWIGGGEAPGDAAAWGPGRFGL